jgi:hypothetical protein
MFQTFIIINKSFTFKLFLSGNKFGFASNIWVCLSIKVLNHILLMLASDHDEQKTKSAYKISTKNKPVKSTDHEAALSYATSDAQLRKRHLLIPYLINIFLCFRLLL